MGKPTSVKTPICRASYVKIWEPGETDDGKEVWSISCLFPKGGRTDKRNKYRHYANPKAMKRMEQAAYNAAENALGEKARALIKRGRINWPFRDADQEAEDDPDNARSPDYENVIFFNANNYKRQPQVVRANPETLSPEPLDSQDEFYSGCWCIASVNFYYYDKRGKKGVGVGLNNIMKIADDEHMDGRVSAEDDFEQVEIDQDDIDYGDEYEDDDDLGI